MFQKQKIITTGILIGMLSCFVPTDANACGSCAFGMSDYYLPPIMLWCGFALGWFLVLSMLCTAHGKKIEGIPSPVFAMLLVLVAVISGAAFIGPGGILLLLLPFPFVLRHAFSKKPEGDSDKLFFLMLRIVMVISIICLCGLTLNSIHIRNVRTASEYILKWGEHLPISRNLLKELIENGRQSLPELRKILQQSKRIYYVTDAAEVIAMFGQPDIDMPLLLNAIAKCEDDKCRNKLASALRKLSGIDLPDDTPPQIWREKWEQFKK